MEGSYKDTHADKNKVKLLIAGATSAAVSRSAIAPLARTTTLFQVKSMRNASIPDTYAQSISSTLKYIWENEGLYGLFKGNGTHLVKKVPFSAIKFLSYERYKQLFTPKKHEDARVGRRMLAGGLAAITAVMGTYPLDLVQTMLAVQTKSTSANMRYKGIVGTLRQIAKEEGVIQWYRGLGVTLLSVVPYISVNLTIWENLKKAYSKMSGSLPGPFASALCGGVSGALASTLTFPLDVLRKHMQLNKKEVLAGEQRTYKGYFDAIAKIFAKDGIRGFYRGLMPHYLTVVPVVAISFGVYDAMKLLLGVT